MRTPHVLLIQWDGFVVNPSAWSDEFLDFDYVGARWGWPTDGHTIVLDGTGPTRILDAKGEPLAQIDIAAESLGSSRYVVADHDGVWVIDSVLGATLVGHD